MRNHSTILRDAGKADEVAEALAVSVHTVRSWIQRDSIPAQYWDAFATKGWASLEELARAAAAAA